MFFLIPLQYMLHFTPCTPPETPLRAIAAAPPLRIGHKSGPRFAAAPLLYYICGRKQRTEYFVQHKPE